MSKKKITKPSELQARLDKIEARIKDKFKNIIRFYHPTLTSRNVQSIALLRELSPEELQLRKLGTQDPRLDLAQMIIAIWDFLVAEDPILSAVPGNSMSAIFKDDSIPDDSDVLEVFACAQSAAIWWDGCINETLAITNSSIKLDDSNIKNAIGELDLLRESLAALASALTRWDKRVKCKQ